MRQKIDPKMMALLTLTPAREMFVALSLVT